MRNRHRVRALLVPLLAAAFLLAGQLPTLASQAGGDGAIEPLAICRDGISFMLWVDFYPAGTEDPGEEHALSWTVPVQAATPVPPADANGRITPPADTLVLDTTVNLPYVPQQLDLAAFDAHRCSPGTRRTSACPGPTRSRWASRTSTTPAPTPCAGTASSRRARSRWC